jgi:hypothetical protein
MRACATSPTATSTMQRRFRPKHAGWSPITNGRSRLRPDHRRRGGLGRLDPACPSGSQARRGLSISGPSAGILTPRFGTPHGRPQPISTFRRASQRSGRRSGQRDALAAGQGSHRPVFRRQAISCSKLGPWINGWRLGASRGGSPRRRPWDDRNMHPAHPTASVPSPVLARSFWPAA